MRKTAILTVLAAGLAAAVSTLGARTATSGPAGASTTKSTTKPSLPNGLKAVAVTVSLPDPTSRPGQALDEYTQAGTRVSLILVRGDEEIVAFCADSKLESFTDDKGTKLSIDPKMGGGFFPSDHVSEDGHRPNIAALSRSVPAGGAKSLTLKGKVVVLCSPRTREAVQKDVALLKGTQIELGPIKAEITDVRGEEQGKRLYVDFTNDTGPEVLKELRFEDAQGKEIKSRQFDSSSAESGGKTILDVKFYDLAGNPDKVTVKAVYYEKIEKFEVPVDLTVSLGL